MKRIGYYYPMQAFIFTLGFHLTQLALSGPFKFWSGMALCLTTLWCIGVIVWNSRVESELEDIDLNQNGQFINRGSITFHNGNAITGITDTTHTPTTPTRETE